MKSLCPAQTTVSSAQAGVPALATELEQYEKFMLAEIGKRHLPVDGVLVPVDERRRVLVNLDDALTRLSEPHRARSLYLSKFVMAIASGLFDAALNYLWDETISELRRRVQTYDLAYFYDLAVTAPDRRKKLQGPDDLPQVSDFELISAAKSMALVSEVGYKQLDLVRYMRNFASAAHPNQTELTGLQIVGFLETCIREVITLPESTVVTEVRRLLANVRANPISNAEAGRIASFFRELRQSEADNLGQGLFGIYVDPNSKPVPRDNVRLLMPSLWPHLSEPTKQGFGIRYGRFVANHDQQQADFARELLDTVDATSYLPENVRVAEIDEAIEALLAAHEAMNNFYNEPPLARRLQALVGSQEVPNLVRQKYISALVKLYLGSPSGAAWNADPIYTELITNFSPREASMALLMFRDLDVSLKLQHPQPRDKFAELLVLLGPKMVGRARDLFAAILKFSGPRDSMRLDSELLRLANAVGS
ncbi:hypothetical protein [Micromonospora sp. B9E7]|uniref:hypothetical protein n=1 Tax=Micromonospora sp. B9E7 TaxID=3153574 RepID=UPI00325F86E3